MDSQSPSYLLPPSASSPKPARPSLSIKSTVASGQRGPPPPSPTAPTCVYPIPIPPSKFPKALKLYTQYVLAEGLAQRHGPAAADPLLSPATAQSAASRSTRMYTPSVSTSTHDAMTDISSVLSFNGEEGSSGQGNDSSELIAYTGERVKQRVRKPLSPTAKAKAALIRCLRSCASCRYRRVPCPLNHHDIEALERGRQARSQEQQHPESQHPSQSSVSASSQHTLEFESTNRAISSGGTLGQSTSLLGLGQNEELLQTFSNTIDAQSFAGDPLAGIQAQGPAEVFEGMTNSLEFSQLFAVDPYEEFQDGQPLPLGVFRQYFFVCQHLDGLCQQAFDTPDKLEEHFATAHFEFTRLNPSCYNRCLKCYSPSHVSTTRCQQCHADGPLEIWVYGTFIRAQYSRPYPPDGHDPPKMDISSLSTFLSPYNLPSTGSPPGPGGGGVTGFNGGPAGGYNYQQRNTFQAPPNRGYGFDSYGAPPSGPYQAREGGLTEPCGETWGWPAPPQNHHRHKSLLIAIVLVVLMIGVIGMRHWLAMKAQSIQSRAIFPALGVIGVLLSFILGYSFWSTKHLTVHRRTYTGHCRPRRCPLHDLPTFSMDLKPIRASIQVGIRGR